ncbi:chaperone protein dnaJ 20, chloroplastic-like [Dendrobium catenatum]|uniref:Chaperone protein dnaJ 20, chloroplastic n=1 Tax=Dendrobium catenatum TaxID=906689 RepID=A0A2I0WPJ4_9ASPA|nr:chaperone protein dnaJ 20, chloroplastic-like [Dendrobium catenatum]PKU77568.1 Chaperone protein dnaJ 20, chloroplastic [Dendrobium catenatum]
MIIRAIMVPNCGNGSICPSPPTTNLSFAGSTGHRRLASMAALRPRLPERPSASRLASRPPAAAGYVGTIGELSATTESFYELLGIPVSGSHDDIKRAYKQLARKYHPDVSPPDRTEEYTQRFILVQEAYETLSDPECRALYDRYLARGLHYALSARRRFGEELEEKSGWKNRWQDQLAELKRRSTTKNSEENLSWGARMRKRRAESLAD